MSLVRDAEAAVEEIILYHIPADSMIAKHATNLYLAITECDLLARFVTSRPGAPLLGERILALDFELVADFELFGCRLGSTHAE